VQKSRRLSWDRKREKVLSLEANGLFGIHLAEFKTEIYNKP
jgi:hypothetical protein